jgi:undecaprenyl-diphosphatase
MSAERAIAALSAPDYFIMRRVHRWPAPRWVRYWMVMSTRGGDGWFWAACGVAVLASSNAARYAAFGAASLAVAAGILVFKVLKRTVRRARPCQVEPHCWAMLLPPDRFSFPSGHTITAFAVAVSLGLFYSAVMGVLLLCAACVAVSRILLGMHFVSDVVAGCFIGTLLGYGSFLLLRG